MVEVFFRNAKRLIDLEALQDSGFLSHLETELRADAIVLCGPNLDGRDVKTNLGPFETELDRYIHLVEADAMENENEDEAFRNTLANGMALSGYLEIV